MYLSVKQLASLLKLNGQTIYRKVDRGEIKSIRIGRTIRFNSEDYIQNGNSSKKAKKSSFKSNKIDIKRVPILLKNIFWEYNIDDLKSTDAIVIERILELGDRPAINWLFKNVSKKIIKSFLITKGIRRLTPRSYNLWKIYFGITDEV